MYIFYKQLFQKPSDIIYLANVFLTHSYIFYTTMPNAIKLILVSEKI